MKALRHILAGAAGIFAMAAFSGSASADLILLLDDGADGSIDATVVDSTDATPSDGSVIFTGALGIWTVNVTAGVGDPVLGPPPEIDLVSLNVSGGAGELAIYLIQTDNVGTGGTAVLNIGGTQDGDVLAAAGISSTNCDDPNGCSFDFTSSLLSFLGSGGAAFSGSDSFAFGPFAGPYSMIIGVWITHTAAGQNTSFDAELKIPEPMTAAIFGMGLLGLGAVRRRRKLAA